MYAVCGTAIITLVGCGGTSGPTLYPVQGTVTVGGKPMANVSVTFAPVDGRGASAGRTNANGTFVLLSQSGKAGAVSGKHKVMLQAQAEQTTSGNFSDPGVIEKMMKDRESSMAGGRKGAPNTADAKKEKTIPAEYNDPKNTPLEFEVKPSSNNFDVPVP